MSFTRPVLHNERQIIYEDDSRSGQVLDEMHKFYQDERFCDIVLCVEGCRFTAHRIVLAASSLYFERMFSNGMAEAQAPEIRLNDLSAASALKALIEFAYTSKLVVTDDTALDIFEAADMLQFPTAKQFCQEFLTEQINPENCLHFMLYADAYNCEVMYEKAKLCAASYFKIVSASYDYLNVPAIHVAAILKEDNIDMEYEEHVYEAMRKWVMFNPEQRHKYLPNLFSCVRLNFVSRWYLIDMIGRDEMVGTSVEAGKIMQRAKDQLLAQGHTYEIPWQLPPSRKSTGMTEKIVYINTHDPNTGESEIYLFDVINKSWSATSRPTPFASELSTCESIGDAVLIIGGWNSGCASMIQRGAVGTVHQFKRMTIFPTLIYEGAHQMGISRYLHSTVVVGTKIYIVGGLDETQSLQATMYVSDPTSKYQCEIRPRMLYPCCNPAVAHHENKIYVFGGFDKDGNTIQAVQLFDIGAEKWVELPIIDGRKIACHYATNIGGIIYIICGEISDSVEGKHKSNMVGHPTPPRYLDRICTFNPITKAWGVVHRFTEPCSGSFSITTLEGKIYITGGIRAGRQFNMVECFNPETGTCDIVGTAKDGCLSLCCTMTVMHENFGL